MYLEENPDEKLLGQVGDVQIWRINYVPAAHRRFQAAAYLVRVAGEEAETFRLPSLAWARFKVLCALRAASRGLALIAALPLDLVI